jgi:N-acetylglucosamine-6-phosphate deacetylase
MYRFGSREDGPWIESNGNVGLAPGGSLASSVSGMDVMVRTMARQTSAALPDVIRMASLTPAQITGMASAIGSIEPGKCADLLVLDAGLAVSRVFVQGRECPAAAS